MEFHSLTDCYRLNDGVRIPCLGLGTWKAANGEVAKNAVVAALRAGYRHIDTAAAYGNEESVGRGILESGVRREEIFVTSKLGNPYHGYEETLAAFARSLEKLGLDYLDMYLIHWPNPVRTRDRWQAANAGTWRAFEELQRAGKLRTFGVSNFLSHHLDALAATAKVAPSVQQIRLCPGDAKPDQVADARRRGLLIEAYSPLGTGKILECEEMKGLSDKYGKSIAQLSIRWCLQMGFLPLPKSVTPARIEENARVFDFEIEPEDMDKMTNLPGMTWSFGDPDTIDLPSDHMSAGR